MKHPVLIFLIIFLLPLTSFSQENQEQPREKRVAIFIHFEGISSDTVLNLQTRYRAETVDLREYLYANYEHSYICKEIGATGTYVFLIELSDEKVVGLKNLRALQPCVYSIEREMKRILLNKNIISNGLTDSEFRLIMRATLVE